MPTLFEASARISEKQMSQVSHFEAVAAYCFAAAQDPTFQNPEVALRVAEQAEQDAARILLTRVQADQWLAQGAVVRVGYMVQDRVGDDTLTRVRVEVADPEHAQMRYARATIAESAQPGGLLDEFAHIAAPENPGEMAVAPLFNPDDGVLARVGNTIAGALGITGKTIEVRDLTLREGNVGATRDRVVAQTIQQFRGAALASAPQPDKGAAQSAAQRGIHREEEYFEATHQVLQERARAEIDTLNAIAKDADARGLSEEKTVELLSQAKERYDEWGKSLLDSFRDPPPQPHVDMGSRTWG